MINYFDIASDYVKEKVGDAFVIIPESICDLDDFYCFTYQNNEFLRTGNFSLMVVGQGYNFIYKKDKRIFSYGSRLVLEDALKDLKERLRIESHVRNHKPDFELEKKFDFQINTISKKQILIDTLMKYRITYVIPEIVGDSIFRIPKNYKPKILNERLLELPLNLKGVDHTSAVYLANDLIKSNSCEFDLILHTKNNYAKYADKSKPEDLKPIW